MIESEHHKEHSKQHPKIKKAKIILQKEEETSNHLDIGLTPS